MDRISSQLYPQANIPQVIPGAWTRDVVVVVLYLFQDKSMEWAVGVLILILAADVFLWWRLPYLCAATTTKLHLPSHGATRNYDLLVWGLCQGKFLWTLPCAPELARELAGSNNGPLRWHVIEWLLVCVVCAEVDYLTIDLCLSSRQPLDASSWFSQDGWWHNNSSLIQIARVLFTFFFCICRGLHGPLQAR